MPCISRVTKTKMTDSARVAAAMRAIGLNDITSGPLFASSATVDFYRSKDGDAFSTTNRNTDRLKAIQRKYSELTVRDWAKRRGFAVAQDGNKLTLINRRG